MQVSVRRGLTATELAFCRSRQGADECRRLLAAFERREAEPAEFGAALDSFRAVHGHPVSEARDFFVYMAATRRPAESVLMVSDQRGTTVLASNDALGVWGMQPLVQEARRRIDGVSLRLYSFAAEGDGVVLPETRLDGSVPLDLYAFINRKPDGHETTMAFFVGGEVHPMMTTDPEEAAAMSRNLLPRFRAEGREIVLRRYELACDVDEREILARW